MEKLSLLKPTLTDTWVMILALGILVQNVDCGSFSGIPGNFCRNRRPSECCDDREDTCEVPIRGTYCYCDEFCLPKEGSGRDSDDCCPDFLEVCKHKWNPSWGPIYNTSDYKPSPALPYVHPSDRYFNDRPAELPCENDGLRVNSGESIFVNCNECACRNGQLICEDDACMIDRAVVDAINRSPRFYGWRAQEYKEFETKKTKDALIMRTGTLKPDELIQKMYPIRLNPDASKIPVHFDARKKLEWAGRVGEVCDQGWCGSSWVFSTLGVAQDRISIVAKGIDRIHLSAQNLLSCSTSDCNGGYADRAWYYLRRFGIVKEECYKYESGSSGKVPQCVIRRNDYSQLTCLAKDRYKMEPAYRIFGREDHIQWEILHNGPVQAMMTVHSDLFMYESGVYKHSGLQGERNLTSDSATHSVRIIGWGISRMLGSQPTKYWLVANSWGTEWGEKGYFRISRGTNECDIESFIIASRAKLASLNYANRPTY